MSIKVIIQFKALAEKQASFRTIMEATKMSLPQVSGCKAVSVMQAVDDPSFFTLVETWENQDQHKAHIDKLIADGTWDNIASHLETSPSSHYFQSV